MKGHWVARVLKFLLLAAAAVTVLSLVVMGLWNRLMPAIFGWGMITFPQALGLLVLSRILFGRFGGRGGRMHWRHRMMERWSQMTPEERDTFMEGMKGGRAEPRVTGHST